MKALLFCITFLINTGDVVFQNKTHIVTSVTEDPIKCSTAQLYAIKWARCGVGAEDLTIEVCGDSVTNVYR